MEGEMKVNLVFGVVAVLSAGFFSQPAGAQGMRPGMMGACAADIAAHCSSVAGGGGRVMSCLAEHIGDVSAACRARIARATLVARACSADRHSLCGGIEPGGGRVTRCMQENIGKISEGCRQALSGGPISAPEPMPSAPSNALQVTLDVSKVTCGDLGHARLGHAAFLAAWISGYRHGKAGTTTVDMNALGEAIDRVGAYCSENPTTLLLDAVEKVAAAKN
jgi:acid stress chaperone HdeB